MATINKIDLNGDTYDIESSGLVTTQPTNPTEGAVYYDTVNDVVKVYDGTNWNPISGGGGGSGDVVGPNSSTNGHVAVFDGTTGKAIKDGGAVPRIINVTVTTAATTADKVGTTTEGNYTPTAGDLLLVNFVNGCGVASPTLNIDGTGARYIRTGNQIASTATFALGTIANSNIKALLYYDGEFYRCWSTSNATYSTLPVAEGKTGTSTNSRTVSAANLKEIIKYHAVSDTAYGSTWDGVTDIAPSKNAVYDKIESLNIPTKVSDLTNDSGYITGINSTDVATALGYTPVNPSTLGTAATKNTGTSSGNVPVLDSNGKLANSTLPGVALTDTFTVSTSSDLTSLSSADQGDLAIVTSENKTYVLSQAPYSTASNWKQILSPTGGVTSVNGQTGAVTLNADNISDTSTTNKFVTQTDKDTWDGKQDELQSGVNIRTINGTSILGSGDITTSSDVTVSSQSGNILVSGMKIWAGTETNYTNLGTYDSNTLYLTVE